MNQQGYHFDIAPSLIRKEGYCDRETILAQRALICLPGLPPSANQGPERRYLRSGGKIQVAAVDLIVADLNTVGQHNNGNVAISIASSSFSGEDQSQGTSVASPVFSSITRKGQLGLRSRVSFPMPSGMDNDRTGQADRNFGSISDKYMDRTQHGPEHDAMAATVIEQRNQQGHIASVWNVEMSEANLVANVGEAGDDATAEPVIPKRRGRPRGTVQINDKDDEDSDYVPRKRAKGKVEEENLWKRRKAPISKYIGRPPKQAMVTSASVPKKHNQTEKEKYLARRASNKIAVRKHRAKKSEEDRKARVRLAELEKLLAVKKDSVNRR